MTISISLKKLVAFIQSGALGRYFALNRPLQVAWANRKQVTVCNEQHRLYHEKVLALCEQYGTRSPRNPNAFVFDEGDETVKPGEAGPKRQIYDQEVDKLESKLIDVPGTPVKVAEAQGFLSTADCELLEGTFLID